MGTEKPQDSPQPAGAWISKDAYDVYKNQQAAEAKRARTTRLSIKIFFILLAVGGLIVAVSFIGGLIAPTYTTTGRGSICTHSSFEDVQGFLNLIGYPLLFVTGIFGAAINRAVIRTLGIILIVATPITGVVLFLMGLGSALCGV